MATTHSDSGLKIIYFSHWYQSLDTPGKPKVNTPFKPKVDNQHSKSTSHGR
jgi:hypothetical protein